MFENPLEKLLTFINSIGSTTIQKKDVLDNLKNTHKAITSLVIPTIEQIGDVYNLDHIEKSDLLVSLALTAGYKTKSGKDTLKALKSSFSGLSKGMSKLEDLIDDEFEELITDSSLTVRGSLILKTVEDINSITSYILDFLYLVISKDITDSNYSTRRVKGVKSLVVTLGHSLSVYGSDYSKYLKMVEKSSDMDMTKDKAKLSSLHNLVKKSGKLPKVANTNGFTGNPIYHGLKWLGDRKVKKYETLQEKKILIELKIAELKMEEEGETNSTISNQIKYYEDQLEKTEYQIKQIEDELED
jgi:hypothetical protein